MYRNKIKRERDLVEPWRAAVGVSASFRLWYEPHFNMDTDGLRSTKGWGASTSQGATGRDIAAPIGPQRGSVKMYDLIAFVVVVFFRFFFTLSSYNFNLLFNDWKKCFASNIDLSFPFFGYFFHLEQMMIFIVMMRVCHV